jgi:hypothetical protein
MKNTNEGRRLARRGFLAAAGAGTLAAATAAATWNAPGARAAAGGTQQGSQVTDAVLSAFQRHRLVAIGEIHGQQEHHDALQAILADPRLPDAVDDIVVESGNALYQPVMDRFTAGGAVDNPALRLVWRNTTQSPVATWDAPVYEQFFRMVRAANWTRPPQRQIRVLLGDPPIDWASVTKTAEVNAYLAQRDIHLATVLEQEVLAKGRRALICYGSMHVLHTPPGAHGGGGVALAEQRTGHRAYVVVAAGHPRLSAYPRRTVIPCQGTWLESADAAGFDYFPKICGVTLGEVADAVLYLGQVRDQTQSLPNPAIYLDPAYWAELQRRDKLTGSMADLAQYRQEQPVSWPVSGGGPSCPPAHR